MRKLGLKPKYYATESTEPSKAKTTTTPAPKVTNVCQLDVDYGACQSYVHKWFYNRETNQCDVFVYGGCLGNENRFDSQSDCREVCMAEEGKPNEIRVDLSLLTVYNSTELTGIEKEIEYEVDKPSLPAILHREPENGVTEDPETEKARIGMTLASAISPF